MVMCTIHSHFKDTKERKGNITIENVIKRKPRKLKSMKLKNSGMFLIFFPLFGSGITRNKGDIV